MPPARVPFAAWAVVCAAIPFHLLLAAKTDLSPDEAYYLSAARLGASLVDHPPLVVWLLGASDRLHALPVELRVRVWAIAVSAALSAACVLLARQRGARESGCVAAAWLSSFTLLPTAGGFVTTPDGPALLALVTCLLWASFAGVGRRYGLAASLVAATGSLAKVIVPPLAAVVALTAARVSIARRLAFLAVIAVTFPLLVPSVRFQFHHAFVHAPAVAWSASGALGALAAAVLAQIALWSPWVLARGTSRLRRFPLPERVLVLVLSGLVAASALLRAIPPEPNWWAPAAMVLLVAAACSADDLAPRRRLAMLLLAVAPTFLVAAHTLRPFLPLARATDPTARLHDWRAGLSPPSEAAGVGPYGLAAERCVYAARCEEIASYFSMLSQQDEGSASKSAEP